MYIYGIIVFLSLFASAIAMKLCRTCDHIRDPLQCFVFQACNQHDHTCFTEVRLEHNEYVYKLDCKPYHDCHNIVSIIGKRAHDHGHVVCRQCCATTGCNAQLCNSYLPATTTDNTTGLPSTIAAVSTTTTNGIQTTTDACRDLEDENFRCVDYDKYHLCTAGGGLEYEIGHKRCQKHCGFCQSSGPATDFNPNTTSSPTNLPVTSPQLNTTTWLPTGSSVTSYQGQTTPGVCRDNEDASFSCADWAAHGLCQVQSGAVFEIAKSKCSKYCGYCQ